MAFEPEVIETDEYVINKPEGFLHVINGDPKYAFEAYSKEYGGAGAEDIRQGTVKLYIRRGERADNALSEMLGTTGKKLKGETEVVNGVKYRITETKRTEKGRDLCIQYKSADRNGKAFIFETARLAETSPEFERKLEAMLNSFELK